MNPNACLVTGAAYPEACHIVPFSFNSSNTNATATRVILRGACKLLGADSITMRDLLGRELGSR